MAIARGITRRVARLEQDTIARYAAYLETLTDDELDELAATVPADERAALDAMTDVELNRLKAVRMTRYEWRQHVNRARRTNDTT